MEFNELIFRTINDMDLEEVIDVYIQVFSAEPWNDELTYEQIRDYVDRMMELNTFKGYIVREQASNQLLGAALGFVRPWYKGVEYHLDSFYVSNEHQGKGVGTQFLQYVKDRLEEVAVPTIVLDTDIGYPSESFYRKNGFSNDESSVTLYGGTSK